MTHRVRAAAAVAVIYGFGLGASTLVLPLLAVQSGYSAVQVGYLAAVSAGAQLLTRLTLGAALRRFPDRLLVSAGAVAMVASFLAVVVSTAIAPFALAMACQGVSRAAFWTGVQAHVVRGDGAVTQSLARIVLMANVGLLAGPVAGGLLVEVSPRLALVLGAALGGLAAALSFTMRRLPPFRTRDLPPRASMWRRGPVIAGCLGVGVAGSWRSLLGSYVPVALLAGGQTAGAIGVFVTLGGVANTVAAAVLSRRGPRRPVGVLALTCLGVGIGMGLVGVTAAWAPGVVGCLVLSGYCAGVLQILGSSLAAEAVHPQERGPVIALTGTVRAVTMLATPLAVAGLLQVAGIAASLAVAGALLAAPAVFLRRLRS